MQLQLMTLNNKSILPGSDRDRDKLYQGLQTEPSPVSPTSYVRQLPYPSSRRDSEVLPPLDPNVYYHLDLQPGLPKPVIQSQHHIRRSTEPNTSEFSWSKSPKYHYLPAPALVPAANAPQSAPASATTAAAAPGKITLPPLSSIAPATGTSPGSEPRSRDDSFTATVLPGINAASTGAVPPSAPVMAEQRSPLPSQAIPVKQLQRAAVAPATQVAPAQAPPQYIQQHQPHQPQTQPHHPQHQPQSHPQHQPQHQPQPQPQHSPTYQFYPLPQEYQYPAYIYPSQHAPHQQQYPVHMVHQPYRPPQFAQPMYQQIPAPPQVPNGQQQMRLLIAQPGMAQGASMAPVFYHQHPISFAHIDNTKKVPRRRTRTGCLTCRKRRIKCDERKPHCLNCEKSRKVCLGYEQPPFQNKNRKYKDELSLDEQEGVREGGAGSGYNHGGASKADSASLNEGESGIQA